MYQRMYGTSHRAPAHRLVPIEHEAWLRLQSPALTVKRIIDGTGGLILVTALLFPLGNMGLVPEVVGVIMVLLTALAVLFSLLG